MLHLKCNELITVSSRTGLGNETSVMFLASARIGKFYNTHVQPSKDICSTLYNDWVICIFGITMLPQILRTELVSLFELFTELQKEEQFFLSMCRVLLDVSDVFYESLNSACGAAG